MKITKEKICILIPCYNEADNIVGVVKNALLYVKDVIVIDDGSADNTGVEAKNAGAIVLTHNINKGKGESLRTGFDYIKETDKWDAVIIMDGDGQHDPCEIPQFIKAAEDKNVSLVIGDRISKSRKEMPLIRWMTNKFMSFILSKIIKQSVYDTQCGYRLIKTEVVKNLKLITSRFDTESEILIQSAKQGYNVISLPIKTIYRDEVSYINPVVDTVRFIKLIYGAISRK